MVEIRVVHRNGDEELIKLKGTCSVVEGSHLNRITTETGLDHFFTKDGYYDGWGGAVAGIPAEEAGQMIESIEAQRHIVGAKPPTKPS